MMAGDLKDRNAQLFVSLVIGLVQAAYVQLGKVRNELTGQIEKNLEAARITIDTLAALELKTKGNLSPEEAEVLRRAVTELRMNFVDEMKKTVAQSETPAEPAAGAGEPPAEAPATEPTT
jgi:uncharacterized protein DUF1844